MRHLVSLGLIFVASTVGHADAGGTAFVVAKGLRSAYCGRALEGTDTGLRRNLMAGILRANLMVPQAEVYIRTFAFAAYLENPIPVENLDLRVTDEELEQLEIAVRGAHAAHAVNMVPTRDALRRLEHQILAGVYDTLINFATKLDPGLQRNQFTDNAFTKRTMAPVALPGRREANAHRLNAVVMDPARREQLMDWGRRLRAGLLAPAVKEAARAHRETLKAIMVAHHAGESPPPGLTPLASETLLSAALSESVREHLNKDEDRVLRRFLSNLGL